jgi:hypothetical protein
MEVLETARVDAYSLHDIVVPAPRRSQVLCVVWEGTCAEQPASQKNRRSGLKSMSAILEDAPEDAFLEGPVWHAGDWTGPISLQPEEALSGESKSSHTHDIVAMNQEGVKVITIDFPGLHAILKSGSALYRRFLDRIAAQEQANMDGSVSGRDLSAIDVLLDDARKQLNVLELLNCNSALRKLTAIQKRHLESLAVGPTSYSPGKRLWAAGEPVDKAFIIISGTASFVQTRRQASVAQNFGDPGESMKHNAETAMKELGVKKIDHRGEDHSSLSDNTDEHRNTTPRIIVDSISGDYATHDYDTLKGYLEKKDGSVNSGLSGESTSNEDVETYEIEGDLGEEIGPGGLARTKKRRSSRARQANKVLGRLYSRRAFTGGLVFSRGHFLGDVSKMVAGLLSSDASVDSNDGDPKYGFGDKFESGFAVDNLPTITETSGSMSDLRIMHNSTLTSGPDGCIVLVFPKTSLIPFLDEYPGLLLSLLGTQVVV